MKKTITRTLRIQDELWIEFKAKYPNMSKELRRLIKLDLEGKI
jgi:hypothetical protein